MNKLKTQFYNQIIQYNNNNINHHFNRICANNFNNNNNNNNDHFGAINYNIYNFRINNRQGYYDLDELSYIKLTFDHCNDKYIYVYSDVDQIIKIDHNNVTLL